MIYWVPQHHLEIRVWAYNTRLDKRKILGTKIAYFKIEGDTSL